MDVVVLTVEGVDVECGRMELNGGLGGDEIPVAHFHVAVQDAENLTVEDLETPDTVHEFLQRL